MYNVVVCVLNGENEDWWTIATFDREEDAKAFAEIAENNETSRTVMGWYVEKYEPEPPLMHNPTYEEWAKKHEHGEYSRKTV